MSPSTSADLILEDVVARLTKLYGRHRREVKARVFTFGSSMTCSLNYSKLLGGQKYFFGLPSVVLDPNTAFPPTKFGDFVLLICGAADRVLVLPRALVTGMLARVASRRIDVFVENGTYVMQTTKHPKLDVTSYLNAFPESESPRGEAEPGGEIPSGPERTHLKVQAGLVALGRAEGCSVWVPVNDRNLAFKGQPLSSQTLPRLPNFGFEETTRRIVRNIDVLWLARNVIRKAFEIESTTSIYSGLLRLNDLVLAQPNNQIELYLVSSTARRNKVYSQLARPSFHLLIDTCRFLSFEEVDRTLDQLSKIPLHAGARVTGLLRGEKFDAPDGLLYPEDF
jgi:hypothetical protein